MPNNSHNKSIRIARLEGFRVLILSGPDRIEFLQGQLTQDLSLLENAGSALSGWASAKGRLLLRSIAMVFDRYLNADDGSDRFSKAI